MPNDNVGNEYSKFTGLADMPYKIVTYLLNNNEDLWKMIGYSDTDCLMKPNLTKKQKAALIYNGQIDSTPYRMFMIDSTDDIFNLQCAFIRCYAVVTTPINHITSIVNFQIDVLCHVKINQMTNYQPRTLRMQEEILSTLNGANIGGIEVFSFDQVGSKRDQAILNLSNGKSWSGYSLICHSRLGKG